MWTNQTYNTLQLFLASLQISWFGDAILTVALFSTWRISSSLELWESTLQSMKSKRRLRHTEWVCYALCITPVSLSNNWFLFDLIWFFLLRSFQLGANGYTFTTDRNGYVLLHPNLRPKVGARVSAPLCIESDFLHLIWKLNLDFIQAELCSSSPNISHRVLFLFRSLTSGSPSLWTFWMQNWRTATRRR